MTIPQSLTREEAKRQIAELQRHIASLPQNNHPATIERGMLFRHKDGEVYMTREAGIGEFRLVQVTEMPTPGGCRCGANYHQDKLFGIVINPDDFTYLGHAKDLLTLKADKPAEVVVTDEMFQRAERIYWDSTLNAEESRRHILTLALNGKL